MRAADFGLSLWRATSPKVDARSLFPSYAGDQLSVDHIIPFSVAPKLDNVITSLALMPLRMNEGKGGRISDRQLDLARKLDAAGDSHPLRSTEVKGSVPFVMPK